MNELSSSNIIDAPTIATLYSYVFLDDCFTVLELVKTHKNVEMYDEQGEY